MRRRLSTYLGPQPRRQLRPVVVLIVFPAGTPPPPRSNPSPTDHPVSPYAGSGSPGQSGSVPMWVEGLHGGPGCAGCRRGPSSHGSCRVSAGVSDRSRSVRTGVDDCAPEGVAPTDRPQGTPRGVRRDYRDRGLTVLRGPSTRGPSAAMGPIHGACGSPVRSTVSTLPGSRGVSSGSSVTGATVEGATRPASTSRPRPTLPRSSGFGDRGRPRSLGVKVPPCGRTLPSTVPPPGRSTGPSTSSSVCTGGRRL